MSLFSGLFGGIVPVSQVKELTTGHDPTRVLGNEKSECGKLYQLPVQTTATKVIASAQRAGELEGQAYLLAKQSRNDLRSQQALIKTLETRLNHSGESMKNEENINRLLAKHGKAEARFRLGTAETHAAFTGYEAQFQQAQASLNF